MPEHETDTIHCDRYAYNGKQKGKKRRQYDADIEDSTFIVHDGGKRAKN
jgi:hypothetical protein